MSNCENGSIEYNLPWTLADPSSPAWRVDVTSDLTLSEPVTCGDANNAAMLSVFENVLVDLTERALLFYNVSCSCTLECDPARRRAARALAATDRLSCLLRMIRPQKKERRRKLPTVLGRRALTVHRALAGSLINPTWTAQLLELLRDVWEDVLKVPETLKSVLAAEYEAAAVPEEVRAYLLLGEGPWGFLAGGRWAEVVAVDRVMIPVAADGWDDAGDGDGGAGGVNGGVITLPAVPTPIDEVPLQFWYPKIGYEGKPDNFCFSNNGYPEHYILAEVLIPEEGYQRMLFVFETLSECCAVMYPWDVSVLIEIVRAAAG